MDNYREKLVALAQKVQQEQIAELVACNLDCETNRDNATTSIKPGKKYDKIDIGDSGKLMVVRETGEVFGIKGYGVIHKGHAYGTLDTIEKWYWGFFYPIKNTHLPANLAKVLPETVPVDKVHVNIDKS